MRFALRSWVIVVSVASGVSAAACSSAPTDEGNAEAAATSSDALAPVDVAFLVPPPPAGQHMKPAIALADGPFLDAAGFHTIYAASKNFVDSRAAFLRTAPEAAARETFYVTGVRYDPCAPQTFAHGASAPKITPKEKCRAELRMVVQPWTETDATNPGGSDVFEDTAIHLVFRPDAAGADALVKDLGAIRTACNAKLSGTSTAKALVGPHPCLADLSSTDKTKRDAALAFVTERIAPLLKKHATPSRLAGAAAMLGINGGEEDTNSWEFRLFANAAGKLVQVPKLPFNPSVEGGDQSVISVGESGETFPVPTAKIQRTKGTPIGVGQVQELALAMRNDAQSAKVISGEIFSDPKMQQGLVGAYAAANPRLNVLPDPGGSSTAGIDCGTCHIQGPLTTILEKAGVVAKLKTTQPALFAEITAAAYANDLQGKNHLPETRDFYRTMLDRSTEQFVVNFGYLERSPAINPRTVNEVLEVVEFLKAKARP